MKQLGEISRMNYANVVHHKQNLWQHIDPTLIQKIQVCQNPSQNCRNVKKLIYHDQLQKTVAYHEEKKLQDKVLSPYMQEKKYGSITKNHSLANLGASMLQNNSNQLSRTKCVPHYTDFDQQRSIKHHNFVSRNCNQGNLKLRDHQEYKKKQQQEALYARNVLMEQLKMKENKKLHQLELKNRENYQVKANRIKQLEMEALMNQQKKMQIYMVNNQVRQQAEIVRAQKARKSYFNYNNIGRHNPITNPIEQHIDNPYILKSYQQKAQMNA